MIECSQMASLSLIPNSTKLSVPKEIPFVNITHCIRVPSWVSLNRYSSPIMNYKSRRGLLENLHLHSLSKEGKVKEALEFLEEMDSTGISVDNYSYKCLLETCGKMKNVVDGRLIHEHMQRTARNRSRFLDYCLLRMYCDCGSLLDARELFDEMPGKDSITWGLMISAYAQNGIFVKAVSLFSDMQVAGHEVNPSVYVSLIRNIVSPSCLFLGKQIHSYAIRTGSIPNVLVETALLNMYAKCGCLETSEMVFDNMAHKNAVTWTGLMMGYTQAGRQDEALELFVRMLVDSTQLDEFAFSVVLKACCDLGDLGVGMQVHGYIIKVGMDDEVSVGTPLVDFYGKCGSLGDACRAFKKISYPNDVSWSSVFTAYLQVGKFEESLEIFKLIRSKDKKLNSFIYTSIFQACSMLGDLNLGVQVHGDAIKRGLVSDLYGESALVTMYSRSGKLEYARQTFELIREPDIVAWTAMIAAYAYHGQASEALRLFLKMQGLGVRPNAITFIGIFTACSHSGLVSEARRYLNSMASEYGVEPSIDHYNCMVDIYSRAGLLEEALELIKTMPFEPDAMSWKSLLGGCFIHRNVKIGKHAAENLFQLDPEDIAGYVLMFNLCASAGKWDEAARIRKVMAERDLKKDVGCSWITVRGKLHRFIVGDRHHPQTEEIHSKLEEVSRLVFKHHKIEYPSLDDALYVLPKERKEQLLDHSERLAIAFGLISLPSNVPILVFKNMRACKDCHEFGKQVSNITGREIIVRDSNRFHHFKGGECSCNDYW